MNSNTQILIADESGDTGLTDKVGTSRYFTIGLVFFDDLEESKKCSDHIEVLKKELSVKDEFKFTKLTSEKKVQFLKGVMNFEWYYFGVIIDKQELLRQGSFDETSFYKYACSLAFTLSIPYLDQVIVVIDGSGSREFQQGFKSYLQKKLNQKIKKFKIEDSKKNNLIQLADMVVGSIARTVSERDDKNKFIKIIQPRGLELKYYPEKT